jgi:S1-C subfamily serine protease
MIYRKHFRLSSSQHLIANRLTGLAVLIAALTFISSSTWASETSPNQITQLKSAVVIITTYDATGTALLQGSGFFINANEVATSLHVIKGANQIRIETFAGTMVTVKSVVATNQEADLALLRLAESCPNSAILQLVATPPHEGEPVMLVSNPQGSRWKITRGNVGLLWEFSGFRTRLQITAEIAPGSSGGPVLNEQGQVVGIAALYVNSAEVLNFAVPVASLRKLEAQARLAGD